MNVYFYLGRLCYLIVYFDPIEQASLEHVDYETGMRHISEMVDQLANGIDQIKQSNQRLRLQEDMESYNYVKLGAP